MSRPPGTLRSSSSRSESPHFEINSFVHLPAHSRYPHGITVHVARPTRSIPPCCVRDTPRDNLLQLTCRTAAIVCQGPALPLFLGWPQNIPTICKANAFVRSRKSFSSFYILTSSFRSLRRFF